MEKLCLEIITISMLMENTDVEAELKSAIMTFFILCVLMNGLTMMLLLSAKIVATDILITVSTVGCSGQKIQDALY